MPVPAHSSLYLLRQQTPQKAAKAAKMAYIGKPYGNGG